MKYNILARLHNLLLPAIKNGDFQTLSLIRSPSLIVEKTSFCDEAGCPLPESRLARFISPDLVDKASN